MKQEVEVITQFQIHQQGCARCKQVDIEHPATLQNACLIGAPLLRDQLSEIATKSHRKTQRQLKKQFEVETRTTKQKLKQITRYAGEKNLSQLF